MWTKRQLTPLGKITILKTLAISKITHLFITLPDPPDTFMHDLNVLFFFFQFLWDSKRSKVSKSVVCKLCEDGGMNICQMFLNFYQL